MTLETIENKYGPLEVQYTFKVSGYCPVGDQQMLGVATITYSPRDRLIEFNAVQNYFKEHSDMRMTSEEMARFIYNMVREAAGKCMLRVELTTSTIGHANVTVRVWEDYDEYH